MASIWQDIKERKILDKDGKVDPLGPYGKQKLTGQEVANYFRKNKVSDTKVKRAVEVALDLGGAYDIARKEIKKFFGDRILKSKEVQNALKYANEEVTEGYRDIIKMYPRDNDWKKLITKHKRHLDDFQKGKKDLDTKVEDELITWALDNGEVRHKGEVEDFIDQVLNASYQPKGNSISEKVEYVEYKFKNKRDAQKALDYFKRINLMKLDINDDNLNGGEIAVDAGNKDLTKYHKEVLKKFRPIDAFGTKGNSPLKKILKNEVQEGKVHDSIIRRDFPNVWAASAKDKNVLKNFHAVVDTRNHKKMKDAYKKDMKAFVDSLKEQNLMNTYRQMWEDGQKYAPQLDEQSMTSSQKREFDKLYKKMDGGKEHQAIKQKIKNPVKADDAFHSLVMKKVLGEGKEFKQTDIDKVAKLTDRNEHTKSLIHIAKVMGDKRSFKKLELIDKLHNEYGHLHSGLKSMRDEVYQDLKDGMKKYDNGQDMYGAT